MWRGDWTPGRLRIAPRCPKHGHLDSATRDPTPVPTVSGPVANSAIHLQPSLSCVVLLSLFLFFIQSLFQTFCRFWSPIVQSRPALVRLAPRVPISFQPRRPQRSTAHRPPSTHIQHGHSNETGGIRAAYAFSRCPRRHERFHLDRVWHPYLLLHSTHERRLQAAVDVPCCMSLHLLFGHIH